MQLQQLSKAIESMKTSGEKRNFLQSVDLTVNFQGIDFSKPTTRLDLEIALPAGRGKQTKICVIAGDELVVEAKKVADRVVSKEEIVQLGGDQAALKRLADEHAFFLCQIELMPLVGKHLGQVLGPRGKLPKPVPGNSKLGPAIERLKKTVRVKTKGKFLPTVHCAIGTEEMPVEDLSKNAEAVLNSIVEKLPNKEGSLKSVFVKTTMGTPVKIQIRETREATVAK